MKVEVIKTGYLEENCYIVTKNNKALIVDPGSDYAVIKGCIKKENLTISGVLITHFHFDHVGALDELLNDYNIEVISIKNKKVLNGFNYEIIETKGHTDDSVSYYFRDEKILFSGDFLFKEDIGRYDFKNSSESDMMNSIKLIKTFDKDVTIYPGHGDETTIGHELENNIYLR